MSGGSLTTRRGFGAVYLPTYKDKRTGELRQSSIWWIQYSVHGQRKIENSHSRNRSDALRLLKKRLGEIVDGRLIVSAVERTRFQDLAELLINDYEINGRRSVARVKRSINHLRDFFGLSRATEITADRVSAFIAFRKRQGAANASINRELAALKRMFRLGKRVGKVAEIPHISLLMEDNVRKGFFEREQFDAVLGHLPEYLKPVVEVAYVTGWRVTSEILSRQWQHVDFGAGWLRLEPGETKNRKGRNFPFTQRLRTILTEQRKRTAAVELAIGGPVPWVFHRRGAPIKSYYVSWRKACTEAGMADRLLHDFRRTAVRNLERAGVPRSDTMAMVGHLTESIYRRYAISDEASLRESAAKVDKLDSVLSTATRS
jgi:integrase